MTPAHTRRGVRRYQYYTCVSAQQRGWHTCPSKSVPAGEIERFVVEQVRNAARNATPSPEDDQVLGTALHHLDEAWDRSSPLEQGDLLHRLVQRVDYDGTAQIVSITFHLAGDRALSDEVAVCPKEHSV
jgi:hypothetical protein